MYPVVLRTHRNRVPVHTRANRNNQRSYKQDVDVSYPVVAPTQPEGNRGLMKVPVIKTEDRGVFPGAGEVVKPIRCIPPGS
ncbi:Glutamine--scyllo-inositol transaminase [Anopheles sinensis]|uniref:Glutamine--scyllo-inositol transaminase n=1 Tax=Anopheles sinensis TaxID=74873 RepID=A0A084WQJ6_ANOSI|nr:Glutamine--scyllo-inositol transaminase [Anopheles sinensis]